MLQYKSEYLRDPYIKELKHSIYDCYRYEIVDNNESSLSIYTSQDLTLVFCGDHLLRIERERRLFAKPHHLVFDNATGEQLGVFEFPNWQSASKTRCILRLNSGEVYSFVENNDHRSLLKPSTWNTYYFEMSNSENCYIYTGNREMGSISGNNERTTISMALGFFVIDDKFRSSEETAG